MSLFDDKNTNNTGIVEVSLEKELQTAYLDYAMSVIVSRAIPDVRDGLKPVQRRILYAMFDNGFYHNRAHKKSARVVGEVISKYHPHGDMAIYDALVRMAQDFSMGTMLVDGQGNFGSIDDDPPAAMRYTEVRMQKIAQTMMEDIDKSTVDWKDNYDGTESEPTILPASYPNILANGSEGIAVGMATNIAPHNLGEVIDACHLYMQDPQVSDADFLKVIPGPDFPTGGVMFDRGAISRAMLTGRGSIILRGKAHVEETKNGREAVIITEIPYQVVKSRLIEKIAELVKDKKIEGISGIRDESNKKGIRVVVDVKRDASGDIVLNHLYKYTQLQSSFAVNSLVLNGNKPELMNTRQIIKAFLEFRENVIIRRLTHELKKTRDRAHVVVGLRVAVDSIDKIIAIIRSSADTTVAKERLLSEYWPVDEGIKTLINLVGDHNNEIKDNSFKFTDEQVKSILEMRLSRLTGLEREKLIAELEELGAQIAKYLDILSDRDKIIKIIADELHKIKEEFAIPRRTIIDDSMNSETSIEDLIEKEDMLVMVTRNGYIKRTPVTNYAAQRRGGKGKFGIQTNEEDDVHEVIVSNTHSHLLFFSEKGQVYRLKTYTLPLGSNQSKGRAIVNLIPLADGDKINTFLPLPENREEWSQYDLIFATKNGNVRRSDIADFENINANGKIAIRLDEDDKLVGVRLAKHTDNVLLASKKGNAIRFEMDDLRVIKSRSSDGVRGMNLAKGDDVVSLCILANNENNPEIKDKYLSIPLEIRMIAKGEDAQAVAKEIESYNQSSERKIELDAIKTIELAKDEQFLLTINENGFGKRTSSYEYRITGRGGKGIINMDTGRGEILVTFVACDADDLVLVDSRGKIIRCSAGSISIIGRNTKGVKVFNVEKGEKVVSVSRLSAIVMNDIATEQAEEPATSETLTLLDV
jgi:DNA gyrase subunit A